MRTQTKNRLPQTCAFLVLLGAIVFSGCNRGGISSGTGGLPGSPHAEVSSSSEVVKVEALPVQISLGGTADATVKLAILAGYHVNANPATFTYLIPTEVTYVHYPDSFCANAGKPIYPPAAKAKFDFAEEPLAVYEGNIEIKLPLTISKPETKGCYLYAVKGTRTSLPIRITVQACDHEKCFPPATVDAAIPVEVK